jgi:serine/threonine protein phosphatase PrpC
LRKHLARFVSSLLCSCDPAQPDQVKLALKMAFANCEAAYEKQRVFFDASGSTCCLLVYFESERVFYIANCGDSRAIVFDNLPHSAQTGRQVTRDHCPSDQAERQRIESQGGQVIRFEYANQGPSKSVIFRVNGMLAVARSFGDVFLRPFITETPDVFGPFAVAPDQNNAVLLACDGTFECNTTQELCTEIASIVRQLNNAPGSRTTRGTKGHNANTRRVLSVADGARAYAYERGTQDNVTALCLQFLFE